VRCDHPQCDREATRYVQEVRKECSAYWQNPIYYSGLKIPYCDEHAPEDSRPIADEAQADTPVVIERQAER